MKKFLAAIIYFTPLFAFAQKQYPADVEAVLQQTKTNRSELEKALQYFYATKDQQKINAINFLVSNMDIHASETYYWADSNGNKVPFDELKYPDFASSIKAFDSLKSQYSKIHPVPQHIPDIDIIKADFLIENTEKAFTAWKKSPTKNISFENFCEYILPYRISVEPLQSWRSNYNNKYQWISDSTKNKPIDSAIKYLITDINNWFTCTYNLEDRKEPLPRLGALQLFMRKKGLCEDVADLSVFSLRSLGIAATVETVPYWATSTGSHFLNTAFNNQNKPVPFDVLLKSDSLNEFIREPAKVLRTTYSKQKNTLAEILPQDSIPAGMLRSSNYIDVTDQYWKTKDLTCPLVKIKNQPKIVYACVINGSKWRPVWWAKADSTSATFTNLCRGAVYLPMYYKDGKLGAAGYPVALGNSKTIVLQPDTSTHSITIKELENYLIFKPNKKYRLVYWSKTNWEILDEKKTDANTKELVFENVPKNALLLLIPEFSKHRERPFIITEEGQRLWW
jgi:hypothetical protein